VDGALVRGRISCINFSLYQRQDVGEDDSCMLCVRHCRCGSNARIVEIEEAEDPTDEPTMVER
jgi:hypothetical protein